MTTYGAIVAARAAGMPACAHLAGVGRHFCRGSLDFYGAKILPCRLKGIEFASLRPGLFAEQLLALSAKQLGVIGETLFGVTQDIEGLIDHGSVPFIATEIWMRFQLLH